MELESSWKSSPLQSATREILHNRDEILCRLPSTFFFSIVIDTYNTVTNAALTHTFFMENLPTIEDQNTYQLLKNLVMI